MTATSDRALTFVSDGTEYMKLCLDVTVYWKGSVFDRIDSVLAFYRKALAPIAQDLAYYETESMRGARAIKPDTLDLIPFWLTGAPTRREIYMLNLESGPGPSLPSDRAFVFTALEYEDGPVGLMRLILPATYIADTPDPFVALALSLLDPLDFHSGHAGYGLNYDSRGDFAYDAQSRMRALGMRYPGIDIPDQETTLYAMANGDGIKRVNWLTFLGDPLVARLGGREALRQGLSEAISLYPLRRGVAIRAGAVPGVGDVNRGELLPLYHEVGALLQPLRLLDHPAFIMKDDVFDEDATEAWLGRFDT